RIDRCEVIRQCKMVIVGLAREREACQLAWYGRVDGFWIVDDQVIPVRLAGKEAIHAARLKPLIAQRFLRHPCQTGIELCFELFPFCTMRVLCAPGQAVQLVKSKMLEDDLQRHVFDNALSPFKWVLDWLGLDP